jgi:hypothetical protein
MRARHEIGKHHLRLLAGIARGPGQCATTPREQVDRLMEPGLVKKKRHRLAPTMKGRVVAWPRPVN